jgi:hypothetical protein
LTEPAPPFLRLALRRPWPPAGLARVVNEGAQPVRLWRRGCSWGDRTLSFRIDGVEVVLSPQVYTVNRPAYADIDPGASQDIDFDLGDGNWTPWPLDPGERVVAVYEIPSSPEAAALGVWTGRIESDPTSLQDRTP